MGYDLEANRRVNGEFGDKTQTDAPDDTIPAPAPSLLDGLNIAALAERRFRSVDAARAAQFELHQTSAIAIALETLRAHPDARFLQLGQLGDEDELGKLIAWRVLDKDRHTIVEDPDPLVYELNGWVHELPTAKPVDTHLGSSGQVELRPTTGYDWYLQRADEPWNKFIDLAAVIEGAKK